MTRIQSVLFGFTLPLRAFRILVSSPKLIALSILPIIITFGLYAVIISHLNTQVESLLAYRMVTWGMDPSGWTAFLLIIVSKGLLFLVSALTFSFMSNFVACPFNDFLAEASEPFTTPLLPPSPIVGWGKKFQLLGIDILKTILATGVTLVALLFSWIPFLNIFAMFFLFMVICFQFISYPQTRRNQGIKEGVQFLWNYKYSCTAFGVVFCVLFSVPFLSCLFLPLAVVGGTLLVAKAQLPLK